MRILFWGTPAFAVPSLRALDEEAHEVVGVVTQPDRPSGRGRRVSASPVREVAEQLGLSVLTPERPRGEEFLNAIRALEPDVSVVVAYGHILKREVLDVPALGSLNLHASILPELRGAAPIHWAIARGHAETGVTVMRMVEAMDAGPVLLQVREPILRDETVSELAVRLSEIGAEALVEALALVAGGAAREAEQDHARATYAPKIDRDTARIDWTSSADDVARLIRAMDSVPGAWSMLHGAPMKLFRPAVVPAAEWPEGSRAAAEPGPGAVVRGDHGLPVGTVVSTDPERGVLVAAGEGGVLLAEVQPSGKRRMAAGDWIRGQGARPGQRFE